MARHVVLTDATDLDQPTIRALMQSALSLAVKPIDNRGRP